MKNTICLGRKLDLHEPAEGDPVLQPLAPSWSKGTNPPQPSEVEEFASYPILTLAGAGKTGQMHLAKAVDLISVCLLQSWLILNLLLLIHPMKMLMSGSATVHYPGRASSAMTKSFLVLALIPTLSILPDNLCVALFILLRWPPATQALPHSLAGKARD